MPTLTAAHPSSILIRCTRPYRPDTTCTLQSRRLYERRPHSSSHTHGAPSHICATHPSTSTASAAVWQVYTGRMPLVGFEPIAAALRNTPVHQLLQQHTYTLLEGPEQVWYFDFLPLRPTSPITAVQLFTASAAPGEIRTRKLDVRSVKLSKTVRLLGQCLHEDPLHVALEFNRQYHTQLHLLNNNCSHHTDSLTRLLLTPHPKIRDHDPPAYLDI